MKEKLQNIIDNITLTSSKAEMEAIGRKINLC